MGTPVNLLYLPESARAYLSPNLSKFVTFAAAPLVLTSFVRNQKVGLPFPSISINIHTFPSSLLECLKTTQTLFVKGFRSRRRSPHERRPHVSAAPLPAASQEGVFLSPICQNSILVSRFLMITILIISNDNEQCYCSGPISVGPICPQPRYVQLPSGGMATGMKWTIIIIQVIVTNSNNNNDNDNNNDHSKRPCRRGKG